MKKILVVSLDLNPSLGSEAGNAHNWILAIAEYFEADVFVHSKHRDAIAQFDYPPNIHFHYAYPDPIIEKPLVKASRFDRINRLFLQEIENDFLSKVRSGEYSLVHFLTPAGLHSYNTLYKKFDMAYIVGPLGGGLRTPKGFGRLLSFKERMKSLLRQLYYSMLRFNRNYREYLRKAERIIIGTEYLFDYLPHDVHHKTVIHFDTIVDMNDFAPRVNPQPKAVYEGKLKLLFSGRLVSVKGAELLIEAVRIALERHEELSKILLVEVFGNGPMMALLKGLIEQYKLQNTVFLRGGVSKTQVIEALNEADIFCLPTIRESGGSAILEAMASSLPIITSDYGGPKFSVTDECGIKIPVNNFDDYVSSLADAIAKLAFDGSLRRRMGESAKARVTETYSLQALKKDIKRIYPPWLFD